MHVLGVKVVNPNLQEYFLAVLGFNYPPPLTLAKRSSSRPVVLFPFETFDRYGLSGNYLEVPQIHLAKMMAIKQKEMYYTNRYGMFGVLLKA